MQRILTLAVVLLFGGALNAQTTPIYNTIPTPLPVSLINQSFQAQRISEFGNQVVFGGTSRQLTSVTVAMVTLGYFSKYNSPSAPNTGGWSYPITLNLYSVNSDGSPGNVITSVTQSFFIPWRPEPTLACGGPLYLGTDNVCHNGQAFDIIFDFSNRSPALILPNQVIFGIAYNTQSAGQTPTGVDGPYNDLNVGFNATNTVGSNPIAPEAYLNGTIGASYADGGAGGVGVFRRDVGGNYPNIAIEFDVLAPPPTLIIYNTIPAPLPVSLINQSFQAQRISEFGNQVVFGGTSRQLTSVTVAMVTLGYFSKYNSPSAPNTGGWNYPITLNLYSVNPSDWQSGERNQHLSRRPVVRHSLATGTHACMRRVTLDRVAPTMSVTTARAFDIIFDFSNSRRLLPLDSAQSGHLRHRLQHPKRYPVNSYEESTGRTTTSTWA